MTKQKFRLSVRCIDVHAVADLDDLYDHDRKISFKTFCRHVDWKEVASRMGYIVTPGVRAGIRLSRDPCVRFYRSVWQGKPCYHMDHSAVDFVFLQQQNHELPASMWN